MPIRKTALWTSIVLTTILSVWCLVVPYWHIHDSLNANRVVRSERRAIWRQQNPNASVDVIFTVVPAIAFAIVAVVLGFSLLGSATPTRAARKPEDESILKE